MSQIRRTQRPPLSCTNCARRKVKCSRTVPCSQCVGRGEGGKCHREVVLARSEALHGYRDGPKSIEDLLAVNEELRQKVDRLSRELQSTRPQSTTVWPPEGDAKVEGDKDQVNDLERMASVTMLLELGRERGVDESPNAVPQASTSSAPHYTISTASLEELASIIPTPSTSMRLVIHAVDSIGWLHTSLHGPTFLREHARFFIDSQRSGYYCLGQSWLALYLSVLAISAHCTEPDPDLPSPEVWFNLSLRLLLSSQWMSVPDINNLHTIINLFGLFHLYGSPLVRDVLMASAVRIAQAMHLNMLGEEKLCHGETAGKAPCTKHGVIAAHFDGGKALMEREIKRRLWWQLLYRDWLSFPTGRQYALPVEFMQVPLPINLDDVALETAGPLVAPDTTTYTKASFLLARVRIMTVMHSFFTAYRQLRPKDPRRLDLVRATDEKLIHIFDDMEFFQQSSKASGDSLSSARWIMQSAVAHKRLLLQRDGFVMAFTDQSYKESRDACVSHALSILKTNRDRSNNLHGIFETTSHCLAAANVLGLDLFYGSSGASNLVVGHERVARRAEVMELVELVRSNECVEPNALKVVTQIETLMYLDGIFHEDSGASAELTTLQQEAIAQASNVYHGALLGDFVDDFGSVSGHEISSRE